MRDGEKMAEWLMSMDKFEAGDVDKAGRARSRSQGVL